MEDCKKQIEQESTPDLKLDTKMQDELAEADLERVAGGQCLFITACFRFSEYSL